MDAARLQRDVLLKFDKSCYFPLVGWIPAAGARLSQE